MADGGLASAESDPDYRAEFGMLESPDEHVGAGVGERLDDRPLPVAPCGLDLSFELAPSGAYGRLTLESELRAIGERDRLPYDLRAQIETIQDCP